MKRDHTKTRYVAAEREKRRPKPGPDAALINFDGLKGGTSYLPNVRHQKPDPEIPQFHRFQSLDEHAFVVRLSETGVQGILWCSSNRSPGLGGDAGVDFEFDKNYEHVTVAISNVSKEAVSIDIEGYADNGQWEIIRVDVLPGERHIVFSQAFKEMTSFVGFTAYLMSHGYLVVDYILLA